MFAPQSHSGFYHCPLSKSLLAFVTVASCALSLSFGPYRQLFIYDVPAVFERLEIWRLLLAKMAFLDTKDLICGGLLMYYFRIFERRFGPRRFLACLLVTGSVSMFLELMISALAIYVFGLEHTLGLGQLPSGPHCFIFPFFVAFFREIPRVAFTHLLGVPVTGKSFIYILGLQMASSSVGSLLLSCCGLVSGVLYHGNVLGVQRLAWPPRPLMDHLRPLMKYVDSPAPADLTQPMGATLELQAQEQMDRLEAQVLLRHNHQVRGAGGLFGGAAAAAAVEVPEEQVQRLVEMGFGREGATNALRATGNDLNLAMNILLQEGGFS